ncbi:MAG: sugar phosphate isomerase/epimerase [candidate division NC10 bacterium]|nr:sugar phosphate isomerase/epimerase [candidate division NC10 bacterium]
MHDSLQSYMKVGIVHFMVYPETMRGEGPILETIEKIALDGFFSAIEVTHIKDPQVREATARLLGESHLAIGFGAQPILLSQRLNLNALNADERGEAKGLLVRSLKEIAAYAQGKGLCLFLETFDAKIDKRCLIGPSEDALWVARGVRKEQANFGLMVDLSHLPLLGETPRHCLGLLKDHLAHIHIGNCVLKDKAHLAYGDWHPRFGLPGGENDVEELAMFLRELFNVGYLGQGKRPVVAFEVKPLPGERSEAIIAGAKRTLREAWARI